MSAPHDDDLRPGTEQWNRVREERRNHPTGAHVRLSEPDEAMRAYVDASPETRVLDAIMQKLQLGATSPSPPKPDVWKWLGGGVAVITLMIGVAGSAQSVVASNQKLLDKIESMDGRLAAVEKNRPENLQRLDSAIAENRSQSDTINAIRESVSEERKQRGADGIENRKALTDIMALISKLSDKVSDIDKTVAVMQGPGRRSDAGVPVHDAQLAQPTRPR